MISKQPPGFLMAPAWRLLRVKNGEPHTLFHAFHGSRKLPQDKVLRAVEGQVWNPGKKGKSPGFISGWHVLPTKEECVEYLKRFTAKDDIVVCRVMVAIPREKPRSKVTLARYMKIDSLDWATALQETQKSKRCTTGDTTSRIIALAVLSTWNTTTGNVLL
jgi:hypothetical protein